MSTAKPGNLALSRFTRNELCQVKSKGVKTSTSTVKWPVEPGLKSGH